MEQSQANLRLFDAHIHTAGISLCSRVPAEKLIDICAHEGLGGIVLTNHYKSAHVREDFSDWRKRYVEEYEITREFGARKGIKVFFGVEVTLDEQTQNDFVLFGLREQDILEAEPLFRLSLPELSAFAKEKGALLYHAHPYRRTEPADAAFLDGVEINCHPIYRTCAEQRVREYADRFGLGITCGSDYHGDTYKPHCGVWIPDTVEDGLQFAAYLRENPRPALTIAPDPAPDASVAPGSGDGVEGT